VSSPSSPRPQPAVTPTEPPARQLIQGEGTAAERTAPALTVALAGLAIAALVLVHAVHPGWGLIWLLWPALLIARRVLCH